MTPRPHCPSTLSIKPLIKWCLLFAFVFLCSLVTSAQTITTIAGTGLAGYSGDNGLAINAKLEAPKGLAIDDSGNLLICNSNAVRRLNLVTGIITTFAGSDTATSFGGGGNGGPATCASVVEAYDVVSISHNDYLIADYWTSTIRSVTGSTSIINIHTGSTQGYGGDGGPKLMAKLNGPFSICFDTTHNVVYLSDEWNYRVRKIDLSTSIITTYAGNGINGFSGDGGDATNAQIGRPIGITVDANGNLFVGDWNNHRIRRIDFDTKKITTIAGNGIDGYSNGDVIATDAALSKPSALVLDSCNNLYFTDEDNNRIRVVNLSTGKILTVAGNGTSGYTGDGGNAIDATFNHPTGLCLDAKNNLYISDYYNNVVRLVALGSCEHLGVEESVYAPLSIHPNPATNHLSITFAAGLQSVSITDMLGRTVLHQTFTGQHTAELPLQLSPGCYTIIINQTPPQKLIIQ